MTGLHLTAVAHSEIGLVRRNNQDSAYISPTMLVVADGMGGAAAGDLASAVAIRELRRVDGNHPGEEMLATFAEAINRASDQIAALVDSDPQLDGMGSTVCGIMFDGEQLGLANIGDSRAYRYRDGALSRLTHDHSWVQTLVDEGRITETEALEHPHRSLILRVINGQPQHQPDLELAEVAAGDRLLVCSDGLCGMVTDAEIAEAMTGDLDQVLESLVGLAHEAGGQDNITVALADVVEEGTPVTPLTLGAAASIDLDTPIDPNTLQLRLPGAEKATSAAEVDPLLAEQARYSPTVARRGWVLTKVTLALLIPLALIAGGIGLWYSYTQQQYYVGASGEAVAVFRGVPDPVLGLPLSTVVSVESIRVSDLPPRWREQVLASYQVSDLAEADRVVAELATQAELCRAQREARVTSTPTPSPSTASPSTAGSSSPPAGTASVAVTAIPSPTPSDTTTPQAAEDC